MKKFSIFHAPLLAFYSKDFYRDICLRHKGTGFAYLLLLLAVCWIPSIVSVHMDISRLVDNDAQLIVDQIPTITIVDGEASIEEPQPFYIVYPETDEDIFVIDTTGLITSLADTDAKGIITKTDVIYQQSLTETRTYSLAEIDEFTLDQDMIRPWLARVKMAAAPVIYLCALPCSFAIRIVQALIYAAIGIFLCNLCKTKRTYEELLRLSVIAVTPMIIIKTIIGIVDISIPFVGLLYFLGAMGFLFFGIKAAAAEDDQSSLNPEPPYPRQY